MSTNGYRQRTDSSDKERYDVEGRIIWERFHIDFRPVAQKFPNNKIYATIEIEPKARELIKHFLLLVNKQVRAQFQSTLHNISIGGFDTKTYKTINIQIRAIPVVKEWKAKESKCLNFSFTDRSFSLNPVVRFEWSDDEKQYIVIINWHPIDDQYLAKYTLLMDDKETHYAHQRSLSDKFEVCIHHLSSESEHQVQIIARLKNGKEKYRSDRIRFTIPKEKDEHVMEVLTVREERIPGELLAIIPAKEEEEEKQEEEEEEEEEEKEGEEEKEEAEKKSISLSDRDRFRTNALELLEKLRIQIEKRRYH